MKIRFYSPKTCLNPSIDYYIPLLFPFWGKKEKTTCLQAYDVDRFEEWWQSGHVYFQLVDSVDECDIVVLPYEWRKEYRAAFDLAQVAENRNKPFVIFFNSDSTENIPIDNAIIFRTSLTKSNQKKNEYALPGWSGDLAKKLPEGKINFKEKNGIPVIGYTGYIDYRNIWEYFKYCIRYMRRLNLTGPTIRGNCVRNLSQSPHVRTSFHLRYACQTGSSTLKEKEEFIQSILDSDYSLVCRGGGNFSYRLYEVLSLGRIPLFIDTDCVLPYDHIIDWKRFCLWVDYNNLNKLDRIVADFHNRVSSDEFKFMQKEARNIYEQWICPTGFYKNMWRCIPGLIKQSKIT